LSGINSTDWFIIFFYLVNLKKLASFFNRGCPNQKAFKIRPNIKGIFNELISLILVTKIINGMHMSIVAIALGSFLNSIIKSGNVRPVLVDMLGTSSGASASISVSYSVIAVDVSTGKEGFLSSVRE